MCHKFGGVIRWAPGPTVRGPIFLDPLYGSRRHGLCALLKSNLSSLVKTNLQITTFNCVNTGIMHKLVKGTIQALLDLDWPPFQMFLNMLLSLASAALTPYLGHSIFLRRSAGWFITIQFYSIYICLFSVLGILSILWGRRRILSQIRLIHKYEVSNSLNLP